MFFQRTDALPCAEGDLVSLRMSLNAPVVATDVAAPAPARAAIAVQRGALPRLCVSVAVRTLHGTGAALVFRPDISSEESESLPTLIEAALSFGESMGFLFDDDELEGADREKRREATARWNALVAGESVGDSKPEVEAVASPPVSFDTDATIDLETATIELGEETALAPAPAVPAPEPAAAPEPAIAAAPEPARLPRPPLTKFRRAECESVVPAPAVAEPVLPGGGAGAGTEKSARKTGRGRAPLARLQLVKRALAGEERSPKAWLQRLLGSF